MMLKKCALLLPITLLSTFVFSQTEPFYKSYDWEAEPKYSVNASDSDDIITLKDKTVREFYFVNENELTEYDIDHQVIWLNSDEQIENNNKIYLPYSSSTELLITKARVITKEGKVIVLDDSKILTAEDEDTKQTYKYFTFEGVEKGSFVEFLYVLKKYPSYKGTRLSLQTTHPKYNIEFDLFSPTNLVFEFKSYNGLDSIHIDTNTTEKLHWSLKVDSIPTLEKEDQSSYKALRQFIIYKLDRNITAYKYDISSYGEVAKNAYSFLYDKSTKVEDKEIAKLIKSTGAKSLKEQSLQIRAVEDYIKKNIFQVDAGNENLSDVTFILKNKLASKTGLLRVYARCFKQLEIPTQLVMTSDRTEIKFDKTFEANNFLNEYLLYFPDIKAYISPDDLSSRLGFPPPYFTNNYGLFIKEVSMGEFNTGIGKIKYINPIAYDKNFDNILVDVTFDSSDITNLKLRIDRATGGYYARYTQPYIHLLDEKTTTELLESHIKYLNENIEIVDKTVYNDNAESFGIKPFRIDANVTSEAFVDKAGKKYLFKLGELIGPQMEMYQEKKRVLPVENEFKRNYHRVITFNIPEGYQINNLDDINIDNETKKDGEILFKFLSTYKVEGNKVTVTADEMYNIIEVAPALYEAYRKVINSAADFNKVTLILEPKQ